MRRDYPLFTIDRTKAPGYPFDYITCYDREVGFIARVVVLPTNIAFDEFMLRSSAVENNEISTYMERFKRGGIAVVISDFFYNFDINTKTKSRIQALLKKGTKKYLTATFERELNWDFSIDDQIKQQELTIERNKANFDALLARATDRETAIYTMKIAEETLNTLKKYKELMQKQNMDIYINRDGDE